MRSPADIHALLTEGKHFCLAPWVHLHVSCLGFMCPCAFLEHGPFEAGYGSLNERSLGELWQGEAIRALRLQMLADEPDPRCVLCHDGRMGNLNMRRDLNQRYGHLSSWVVETDEAGRAPSARPVFWDVRFSNVCNLRCRSCTDASSSAWHGEATALGLQHPGFTTGQPSLRGIEDGAGLLRELERYLPEVEAVRFAGGEPMLMEENHRLLRMLDELGRHDVRIEYETNFTQLPRCRDLLPVWNRFGDVLVSVSLDGLGARCEYLRKGLSWRAMLESIAELRRTCPRVQMRINCTVTAYNILHLPDFHREMVQTGRISAEEFQLICAVDPPFMSMKVLPADLKRQATRKLKDHIRWLRSQPPFHCRHGLGGRQDAFLQWPSCLRSLNADDWSDLLPRFLEHTASLDALRDEDCASVFPELADLVRGASSLQPSPAR